MNTWKVANAVVRHLEATIPVYDVSELRVRDDVGGWAW